MEKERWRMRGELEGGEREGKGRRRKTTGDGAG